MGGRRDRRVPAAPLPLCRPQHSSVPKEAGTRVWSEVVGETPNWKCTTGVVCVLGGRWGQPSRVSTGSGAGPRGFQGIEWAKGWKEGTAAAHRGSLGAREPHPVCAPRQGCVHLWPAGGGQGWPRPRRLFPAAQTCRSSENGAGGAAWWGRVWWSLDQSDGPRWGSGKGWRWGSLLSPLPLEDPRRACGGTVSHECIGGPSVWGPILVSGLGLFGRESGSFPYIYPNT